MKLKNDPSAPAPAVPAATRRRTAACLMVLALLAGGTGSAAAQSAAEEDDAEPQPLGVRLLALPIGIDPTGSLDVLLEIANPTERDAEDLEVTLQIHQGVTSVSDLQGTYRGQLGPTLASDTIRVDGGVEAGESRVVGVSKPLSELAAFRNSTIDRAYPVRILVRSAENAAEPIDTHMIYYSEPPEKPLSVALVLPLHSPSIYGNGAQPELVTSDSLYRSISQGRLDSILTALEQFPDLPVTLAPTGMLLSMLQDLAEGYQTPDGAVGADDPRAEVAATTLDRLRGLAGRPQTRVIATSYSPTPLPALSRAGLQELALTQLNEGRNTLLPEPVGLLRTEPLPGWLLLPGGSLDQPSVATVHRADVSRVILDPDSLRPVRRTFTRGLPARLEGGGGSATTGVSGPETTALIADAGLRSTLMPAEGNGPVATRQRFAAETATIHLETPGLIRAVVAVAPWDWDPGAELAAGVLATLATSVWITPSAPGLIVSDLEPPTGESLRLASTESVLDEWELPDDEYFDALETARDAISRYSALAPPAGRLGALTRRLLFAQSAEWWETPTSLERGSRFATEIPATVAAELDKVRGPGPQTITLTSKTGVIPLSLGSGLDYPVDVVVRLGSDKLRFPDGNRVNVQELQPPSQTIRVRASTEASGTFPVQVQVFTPGGVLISDTVLTVRSTAYNVVALSITGGAALFLIGWWVIGAIRKRTRHPSTADTG